MAASTLLFWTLGPAGADLYTVGIQVGNLSFTGFVIGVVYLVVVGRPNFKHWRLSGLASIVLSLLGSVAGLVVVEVGTSNHKQADLLAVSFFGIGGAALAYKGVSYVREACLGNPNKLAGATLIPNVALLLGLVGVAVFRPTAEWSIILPAMLWMLGSFVLLFDNKPLVDVLFNSCVVHENTGQSAHFVILLVGLITSSFMPFIYMHILSGEPDGTIGLGFLLIRIVSSATYLVSSSLLLVRFNWRTNRNSEGKHEAQAVFLITALEIICLSFAALNLQLVAAGAAIMALAIGLFTSSTLLRELNFARKGKALLVKVILDLLVSSVAAYALFVNPSVLGLFTVYLVSQIITIMIASWGLGFSKISAISLFCLILCCATLSLN
jgi:hypothetical protein